jgi:hypothetical protein
LDLVPAVRQRRKKNVNHMAESFHALEESLADAARANNVDFIIALLRDVGAFGS